MGQPWNKGSESPLSPLRLMQLNWGEIHVGEVGVALATCLVAGTFAAGQGANPMCPGTQIGISRSLQI
jgi:hypothetical protein